MQKLFLLSSAVAVLWSIVLLLPSEAGSTPTAPRAPINVTADPGNARATISWDAPPSAGSTLPGNGGANITGYKVTVSPGGTTIEPLSLQTPLEMALHHHLRPPWFLLQQLIPL